MIWFVILAATGGFLAGAVVMAVVVTAPEAADRRAIRRHREAQRALRGLA